MHEMSLAMSLIEEAEKVARRENASRVNSVTIAVGEWSGVETESFEFCFPLVAEGTLLQGARLKVERIPVTIGCKSCGGECHPRAPLLVCSACGSKDVSVVKGREFMLTSLEID